MKSNFSTIAVGVRESLKAAGSTLSLGHIQQMLAASLGYNSLAALQASTEEQPGIEEADYVILDVEGVNARAAALGFSAIAPEVTQAIVATINSDLEHPMIFVDDQEFIDDVICPFANEHALGQGSVCSAAAETNAYFDEVDISATDSPEAVKESREFWEIPIEGNISMDQDEDKPFSGNKLLVKGVVRIWKAGRVCLMNDMELDIGASVDDSYYYDPADGLGSHAGRTHQTEGV